MSSFLFSKGYQKYNKQDLFKKIDAIEIVQSGKVVITKYFGRVINNTNVSDRYEIFDIRSFMKSKIEYLESNFNITFSNLRIRGGIQELILLSDEVEIAGINYHKAFFILNSSDKSRRLSMNLGLYQADNGTDLVNTIKNFSLITKHLKGITDKAEVATQNLDVETFDAELKGEKMLLKAFESIAKSTITSAQNLSKKKVTITCVKGKLTKKVTGINPKCPSGYKKK